MSDLGLTLCRLRRSPEFSGLPRGSWLLFVSIACHWERDPRAWPSKGTIARFSGYSARAVRDGVDVLVEHGVLVVRREQDDTGAQLSFYGPGPATLGRLGVLRHGDPAEKNAGGSPHPLEKRGGGTASFPAEGAHRSPLSMDKKKDLLLVERGDAGLAEDDRAIACAALAEYFERAHPASPASRAFDGEAVTLVTACAAAIDGDRDTKLQAMRDAIDAAFRTSKQTPRVRYIWGRIEYFLAHAGRGKRARLDAAAPEPAAALAAAAALRAPCSGRPASSDAPVGPRPEQMSADLDRLFGPNWRSRR
ncbi:MAG TPA: hypothetical protein VGL81_10900 [Polyangiaceae bacterium]|jgi:hypothetical protein